MLRNSEVHHSSLIYDESFEILKDIVCGRGK